MTGTTGAQDGSGTWANGSGSWWNGSVDVTWNNANGDFAVFGNGGGGTTAFSVTVSSVTAGSVTFNSGGAYTLSSGTITLNGSGGPITANVAAEIDSAIAGSVGLTKNGSGTLTLGGVNTYTTSTAINAGVLRINGASSLTAGNISLNGGVLGLGTGDFTRALGTGSSQVQFAGSGGFAAYGADRNVNIGGSGATLTWGSTANFLGTGSSLILGASDADKTITFQNPIDLNKASRMITVNDGAASVDAIISGNITGNGQSALIKGGAGTLAVTGAVNSQQEATISAGTLQFGNGGTGGTFTTTATTFVDNGTLAFSHSDGISFTLATSGTGGVDQRGSGVLTFGSTSDSYAGDTTVSSGTLKLAASEVIPNGAGKGNVSVIGTLDLNGFSETINGLSGTGTIDNTAASTTPTLTVGDNNQTSIFGGVIKNTAGTLALGKVGTGTLTLNGNNTFTGGLTINGGTVQLGNSGALNSTTPNAVSFTGAGTLNLGGNSITVGSLSGTQGTVNNGGSTATLTVKNAGAASFSGNLVDGTAGTLALNKDGSGQLTLGGNNTYTGGTTLTAGKLTLGSTTALPTGVSAGGVKFSGGQLELNNQVISGTVGALTMTTTGSSILLAPDTTHGSITFSSANFSSVLKIFGWLGSVRTAGTDDRIFISGATAGTTFANVTFYSDTLGNNQVGVGGIILSGGELVPAPEPTNIALGLFGAAFIGFNVTRRHLRKSAALPTTVPAAA